MDTALFATITALSAAALLAIQGYTPHRDTITRGALWLTALALTATPILYTHWTHT